MSSSSQRALVLFGLTAGLAGLAGVSGCVESQAPRFVVSWDVVYVGNDDQQVRCQDAGTPTVELTMTNTATGKRTVNRFNCEAQGGESEPLPAGRYAVKIALLNKDNLELSNLAGEDWTLVRDSRTDLGVITFPVQAFHLNWTLHRGMNSLACQDVDAAFVNIIARRNSDPEVVYPLPCTAGSGSTPAIPVPGSYSVRIQLVSSKGAVLWDTEMPMTIPVNERDPALLPNVAFNL